MAADKHSWHVGIEIGDVVDCHVRKHAIFGVFVLVDGKVDGLIERVQMERNGYTTPGEYPPVGHTVRARFLGFRDYSRQVEVALLSKLDG